MLTAAKHEQRLLRFTRERLASREVAPTITVETRLFEDRVIDSLKVLELIAFVQSTLRRKIPDAQIVLANFRSIATIARVFTNGDAAIRRVRSRRPLRHSNGNASAVTELLARREVSALRRRIAAVLRPGYELPNPSSAWSVPWPPV